MNYDVIAKEVLENIGGRENVQSVAHCATRLRIMVLDESKINKEAIDQLEGVKGAFFNSGQYQIIFGTGTVNKVYEAVARLGVAETSTAQMKEEAKKQGNLFQRMSRTFGDVFVPIIPVLVATGLFMGLRGLLTNPIFLGLFGMTPDVIDKNFLLIHTSINRYSLCFLTSLSSMVNF